MRSTKCKDEASCGTLIRTAAAAGVQQVWLCSGGAFAWRVKTLRAFNGERWATLPHDLAGVKVISLFDAKFGMNNVMLLSNEGHGLTPALLPAITDGVSIPMAAGVESFNVATAGSIVLYAAQQQRAL